MEVKIFENSQFGKIRTAGGSENPQFCLTDVCKALGLSAKGVNQRLSDEVISNYPIQDKLGRSQQALFVNEDGLYDVILDSRKPEAKAFRKWITSEVLPSIRKTGGYIATTAEETAEQIMAKALRIADETLRRKDQMLQMAQSTIQAQEKEIKEMAPMAEYSKGVLQSDSTYTLTQVSKDLNFRSVYAFLAWAQGERLLYKQSGQWMPTKKVSGRGFFTTRTAKFNKKDGTVGSSISTVVTETGRAFLHNLLSKKGGAL